MLISKYDPRSVLQTPSFCFSVKSPSLNFKYPTTKDTFHLQREGKKPPTGCVFGCMVNMDWESDEIKKEMEGLIQEALEGNQNLVFEDGVHEWVDLCLDSLGLLQDSGIQDVRDGLKGVAKEVYESLKGAN